MTTIAVRGGTMAADSQATHQGLRTLTQKIYRVKDVLIGCCGDAFAGMVFVDWYGDRELRRPDLTHESDFEAVVLTKDGIEHWTANLRPLRIPHQFYAIGSGSHLAIGSMMRGGSAKQAVLDACAWDTYSSPPVIVAKLA